MVSGQEKEFIWFPCFSFSTTPLYPSNTLIWGDLEKGIFVLPTSHGMSSPTCHTVGVVFHLLTTSKKVGNWSSQMMWWRVWTPATLAQAFTPTGYRWTWSPCTGTLEAVISSRVSGIYCWDRKTQAPHSSRYNYPETFKVLHIQAPMVGAFLVWKNRAADERGIKLTNHQHPDTDKLLKAYRHFNSFRILRIS